ncbi:MAG: hypothetical protein ACFB4J_03385 [Elainellaceae cyanobacterium]
MICSRSISRLARLLTVGLATIALCISVSGCYIPAAQAATTQDAEAAYEAGPIRQTYSPLSKENYNGGVKQSALEDREERQQPDDKTGILDAAKNLFTDDSVELAPTDLKTEKNPTLKRYTDEQK